MDDQGEEVKISGAGALQEIKPEEGVVEKAPSDIQKLKKAERDFLVEFNTSKDKKYDRFVLAILGSLPWVGSVLSASASLSAELAQERNTEFLRLWIKEHQEKIKELGVTIQEIINRLDSFGEEIRERIQSPHYLELVRKTFTSWDQAETQEKRQMFKKLITNAGAIKLCPDDLIRLFISWINQYHESHFAVIKEIYRKSGITRGQIWDNIHNEGRPRDDSSEADLFRYLIRDLSMGGVIRQEREVNAYGQFIKRRPARQPYRTNEMESAFEDTKPYELTELGKKFVHYVMEDVVPQLEQSGS